MSQEGRQADFLDTAVRTFLEGGAEVIILDGGTVYVLRRASPQDCPDAALYVPEGGSVAYLVETSPIVSNGSSSRGAGARKKAVGETMKICAFSLLSSKSGPVLHVPSMIVDLLVGTVSLPRFGVNSERTGMRGKLFLGSVVLGPVIEGILICVQALYGDKAKKPIRFEEVANAVMKMRFRAPVFCYLAGMHIDPHASVWQNNSHAPKASSEIAAGEDDENAICV